jgi:hypothetical protein
MLEITILKILYASVQNIMCLCTKYYVALYKTELPGQPRTQKSCIHVTFTSICVLDMHNLYGICHQTGKSATEKFLKYFLG